MALSVPASPTCIRCGLAAVYRGLCRDCFDEVGDLRERGRWVEIRSIAAGEIPWRRDLSTYDETRCNKRDCHNLLPPRTKGARRLYCSPRHQQRAAREPKRLRYVPAPAMD